ncbi:hypothetical protein [Streptomyces sp. S.PNR 29]|uniref:hypothetical protein n=1 Tax=Streptomyces sp. S.PNR 29 TaxID=2973805 RepID=UPI0025B0B00C|nr:hypothetical protein [Streptomyces sp. S.PNR 29]MDN0196972.1 hypothetical protein [Streptomyces sp. S.PNR 29]
MHTTRSPLGRTPLPLPDCDRCGFTSSLFPQGDIADLLRDYASGWQRVLTGPGHDRRRVGVPRWSPLEHGCHVRDMCLLFHLRLDAMLGIAPSTSARDAGQRYRDEIPTRVAEELGRAAEALARRLAGLGADDWNRGDPGLADPRLTVEFFTRHLLHDIAHGLAEVRRACDGGGAEQRSRGTHG